MALPKRPVPNKSGGDCALEWIDPEFVRDLPSLKSFLADQKYADGTTRLTGSISVFTKAGVLTVAINDNDRGVSGFLSAATWAELFYLLEEGIREDSIDWKARRPSIPANKPPF